MEERDEGRREVRGGEGREEEREEGCTHTQRQVGRPPPHLYVVSTSWFWPP